MYEAATGEPPELPPIQAGEYLASAFSECGMVETSSNGPVQLSWQEIHAYAQATQAIKSRWECVMIRQMSVAYLDGFAIGRDEFGIVPWEPENG